MPRARSPIIAGGVNGGTPTARARCKGGRSAQNANTRTRPCDGPRGVRAFLSTECPTGGVAAYRRFSCGDNQRLATGRLGRADLALDTELLWTRRQVEQCEFDELAEGAVEMFRRGKRSVPRPRLRIRIELEMKDHRRPPERRRALVSDEQFELASKPPPRLALGETSISADRQRRLNRIRLSHPDLVDRRAFPCVHAPPPMRGTRNVRNPKAHARLTRHACSRQI